MNGATLLAAGNGTTLWYLTRGSGVVALLLLTGAVVLGVVSTLRWRAERWPRFAVNRVHRNLTLVSIVFVVLHVVTTVLDGYAPIGLKDSVIPFASPYRPIWLGLGAVSFDLLLALVVTSLLRARIPTRIWRAVHWLAYAAWPVALLHSFGTGSDARFGWLAALGIACLVAVALAALARVGLGQGQLAPRIAGGAAALLLPLGILVWYAQGPLRHGWAKRAGTPTAILARGGSTSTRVFASAKTVAPPTSFSSNVTGTVSETENGRGLVTIHLPLRLAGGPRGAARIELQGVPTDRGVEMTASGVSFVPATTRSVYTGSVTGLDNNVVVANVSDSAGDQLNLTFRLNIDSASGSVSGSVSTGSAEGDSE